MAVFCALSGECVFWRSVELQLYITDGADAEHTGAAEFSAAAFRKAFAFGTETE